MKKIRTFYSNLRIKHKMFLLISFVLVVFSLGGISILQYAFNVYNQEIYRQSAQALSVSSNSIEIELKKMERLSYQVATDEYLQKYLFELKQTDNEFDRFLIGTSLRKRLLQIGALNKYVNSLQVYDLKNTEYKVGNHQLTIGDDRLKEIKSKAQIQEGAAEWIFPDGNDPSLIVVRDVRHYLTLSLKEIGTVAVRFNIEDIVSDLTGDINKEGTNLIIFNEHDELVYPVDSQFSGDYVMNNIRNEKGYNLIEIDDEQYFATHMPARQSNWTYVIISPYGSLFQAISSVRKAVIITYTVLFIFVMIMGMRFIGTITRPIESLNKKMHRVQTGDFDLSVNDEFAKSSKDELGEMHHNFQTMMEQINALIEENYKKQIAIKDSEFKTLQAQINPHFLYNTLDSINWAAKMNGQKKISEIAESLGHLLRASINMKEALITMGEELKVIKSYITIQSYRFEERLVFNMNIEDEVMDCKVPKFILQPLIENSIQYGLQQMIGHCEICIQGKVIDGVVVLTVEDNGPGIDQELLEQLKKETYESKGTGLGLKNIRERIKLLFGEPYGIEVKSEQGRGTQVLIRIPYDGGRNNV